MKLGEVYKWETTKAKGHEKRPKFHVFICDDDLDDGYTFLFISSDDISIGGDYRITKPPYDFLTKLESYISCSSVVTYATEELKDMGNCLGQISQEHLIELHQAIANSNTMTGRHIKRCCNALKAAFG